MDHLLHSLEKIEMRRKVNIILISDHGMTDVSVERHIDVVQILKEKECLVQNYGTFMMVEPESGNMDEIYNFLVKNKDHYQVYKKEEIPEFLHFSHHPFISSIVVIPDRGWLLADKKNEYFLNTEAFHGYSPHWIDMHGIFLAVGPAFKRGFQTGTLRSIDIYPLLCEIFKIQPRHNIDGRLDQIEFILK